MSSLIVGISYNFSVKISYLRGFHYSHFLNIQLSLAAFLNSRFLNFQLLLVLFLYDCMLRTRGPRNSGNDFFKEKYFNFMTKLFMNNRVGW